MKPLISQYELGASVLQILNLLHLQTLPLIATRVDQHPHIIQSTWVRTCLSISIMPIHPIKSRQPQKGVLLTNHLVPKSAPKVNRFRTTYPLKADPTRKQTRSQKNQLLNFLLP